LEYFEEKKDYNRFIERNTLSKNRKGLKMNRKKIHSIVD